MALFGKFFILAVFYDQFIVLHVLMIFYLLKAVEFMGLDSCERNPFSYYDLSNYQVTNYSFIYFFLCENL